MKAMGSVGAIRLDFGEVTATSTMGGGHRRGLRLAPASGALRGPDKYRVLALKRRRAQIRARRELGLG
jgi:hypothetical protein